MSLNGSPMSSGCVIPRILGTLGPMLGGCGADPFPMRIKDNSVLHVCSRPLRRFRVLSAQGDLAVRRAGCGHFYVEIMHPLTWQGAILHL